MSENWYAVYTKPRWEKKVADTLTIKHIENYCPLNKVVRQWSDRKKIVLIPLFTSYVFVHITDKQFSELIKVDGIINFVHWLGKPAVIRDSEIETIKRFLNEHNNVHLEKTDVYVHDQIKITNGILMDKVGTVVSIKSSIVKIALPSLGYVLYAAVDKSSIIRVDGNTVK